MAILDESLLAGLGSGDHDAAAAFVRRFQGRVFGLAMSILRDPEAAEEVAQETFVRAWRHASAYDPRKGAVATWLLTIARNLAIDAVRVRRAVPVAPDLLTTTDLHVPPRDHDPSDELTETLELKSALARLPDAQRRALLLAAIFGCTAAEISALDQLPLGTVKTRIRSAMNKLRADLGVKDEH